MGKAILALKGKGHFDSLLTLKLMESIPFLLIEYKAMMYFTMERAFTSIVMIQY